MHELLHSQVPQGDVSEKKFGAAAPDKRAPLLTVENLSVSLGSSRVVNDASLRVFPGEVMGIVGESGAGKSTLLKAIAHLLPRQARIERGLIQFEGGGGAPTADVLSTADVACPASGARATGVMRTAKATLPVAQMGGISYLFQNGPLSLDPLFMIDSQFNEVIRAHGKIPTTDYKQELLLQMGVENPSRILASYPHELSGGLCQRCVLAFALATEPQLLLADEPTSALDNDAQRQVGSLLRRLNVARGMAILLVGHDIDFIASLASRVIVMREGAFVEEGLAQNVLKHPQNSYTKELIAAIPRSKAVFKAVGGGEHG